jgi:predicted nucleic acid-binding protein
VYTLDTNAIIYYLKDDADAAGPLSEIFSEDAPLYISAITEVELFGFPNLSEREGNQIEAVLRTMAVIPLDSQIARTAGYIRRTYRSGIADSVIAATALFTGTKLLTRNVADFKKIPELVLQKI